MSGASLGATRIYSSILYEAFALNQLLYRNKQEQN